MLAYFFCSSNRNGTFINDHFIIRLNQFTQIFRNA